MNKQVLFIALTVLAFCVCVGSTVAFFTATDTSRVVITAGNIDIVLHDTDAQGNTVVEPVEVMPGTRADRIVTVENVGDKPCWVRISVEKVLTLAEECNITPDISIVGLELNTADWTEKEGYYYYNNALTPKSATSPLMTGIAFAGSVGNEYQASTATLHFFAEAVQTDNNGTGVFEAAGWPGTGKEGNS